MHYKKKPKMEFSKKWLIGCVIISLVYTTLSYILAFKGLDTVEQLSIEILQTLWGTAYTSSKWGIPTENTNEVHENRRGD